jgi:hypothetical protein
MTRDSFREERQARPINLLTNLLCSDSVMNQSSILVLEDHIELMKRSAKSGGHEGRVL